MFDESTLPTDWTRISAFSPPEGVPVLTRIDDGNGERNEAVLVRKGKLWFFEDYSMYVYYVPTHYKRRAK